MLSSNPRVSLRWMIVYDIDIKISEIFINMFFPNSRQYYSKNFSKKFNQEKYILK